jgi:hypothetical protein
MWGKIIADIHTQQAHYFAPLNIHIIGSQHVSAPETVFTSNKKKHA